MYKRWFIFLLTAFILIACGGDDDGVSLEAPPAPERNYVNVAGQEAPPAAPNTADPAPGDQATNTDDQIDSATAGPVLAARELRRDMQVGSGTISGLAWSADPDILFLETSTGIWQYNIQTGDTETLTNYRGPVAFNPDGSIAIGRHIEGDMVLFNATTGEEISRLAIDLDNNTPIQVGAVQFSPDGNTVSAVLNVTNNSASTSPGQGIQSSHLHSWSVPDGEITAQVNFENELIIAFTYNAEGDLITFSGGQISRVLRNVTQDSVLYSSDENLFGTFFIQPPQFTPDGRYLIFRAQNNFGTVDFNVLDTQTGQSQSDLEDSFGSGFFQLYPIPDGSGFVTHPLGFQGLPRLNFVDNAGQTGQSIEVLSGVNDLEFGPQVSNVAIADNDSRIIIFNINTGQEVTRLEIFDRAISQIAYNPTADEIYVARSDANSAAELQIYDPATGEQIDIFETVNPPFTINDMAFSADGQQLATGGLSQQGQVSLWDMNDYDLGLIVQGYRNRDAVNNIQQVTLDTVNELVFMAGIRNGDNLPVLSGYTISSSDLIISIQELFDPNTTFTALEVDSEGQRLTATTAAGTIYVWNVGIEEPLHILENAASINDALLMPDGETLVVAGSDGTLQFWNVASGTPGRTLQIEDMLPVAIDRDDSGEVIAVMGYQSATLTVTLIDVATGQPLAYETLPGVQASTMAYTGNQVVLGGQDGLLNVLQIIPDQADPDVASVTITDSGIADTANTDTSTPDADIEPVLAERDLSQDAVSGSGVISGLAWSPEPDVLFLEASTGIWQYNIDTGETEVLPDYRGPVDFNPDGTLFTAYHIEGDMALLSTTTGEEITRLTVDLTRDPPVQIGDVKFSPDGSTVTAILNVTDGTPDTFNNNANVQSSYLQSWSVPDGTGQGHREAGSQVILAITYNPAGDLITFGQEEDIGILYNVTTDTTIYRAEQGISMAFFVEPPQFTLDGQYLIFRAPNNFGTVEFSIIDTQTGEPQEELIDIFDTSFPRMRPLPDGSGYATYSSAFNRLPQLNIINNTGETVEEIEIENGITNIAFAPDNTHMAIIESSGQLSILNINTGTEITRLDTFGRAISEIVYNPGADELYVARSDFNASAGLQVYDPESGEQIAEFEARNPPLNVSDMALSPDGQQLIVASLGEGSLWNTGGYSPGGIIEGRRQADSMGNIQQVAFNASLELVMVAGLRDNDEMPILAGYDSDSGRTAIIIDDLFAPDTSFTAMAFTPDGQQFLLSTSTGQIYVWDVDDDPTPRYILETGMPVADALFMPDGDTLLAAGEDGTLQFWSLADGTLQRTLQIADTTLRRIAINESGELLIVMGHRENATVVTLIDTATGQPLAYEALPGVQASSMAYTGDQVIVGGRDGTLHFLQITLDQSDPDVASITVTESSNSDTTATPTDSPATLATETVNSYGKGTVDHLVWSPDGEHLLLEGSQGIWLASSTDTADATLYEAYTGPAAFSPDGSLVASRLHDAPTMLAIWNAADGSELWRAELPPVEADNLFFSQIKIKFSPDGDTLITQTQPTTLHRWSVADGSALDSFELPVDHIQDFVYTPEGTLIAMTTTVEEEGQISPPGNSNIAFDVTAERLHIYDVAAATVIQDSGEELYVSVGNTRFSPDARYVVFTSQNTVRRGGGDDSTLAFNFSNTRYFVFDVENGGEAGELNRALRNASVAAPAVFSPDSSELAAVDAGFIEVETTETGDTRTIDEPALLAGPSFNPNARRTDSLAFSPDGTRLAVVINQSIARVYSVTGDTFGQTLLSYDDFNARLTTFTVSPDATTLYTGYTSGLINVFDMATGEQTTTITATDITSSFGDLSQGGVNDLVLNNNGDFLYSAYDRVNLTDLNAENATEVMRNTTFDVLYKLALSPDETYLAIAGGYNPNFTGVIFPTIRVWDMEADEMHLNLELEPPPTTPGRFEQNTTHITGLQFRPDGEQFAVAISSGSLHLINAATGDYQHTLQIVDNNSLHHIAYNPDGTLIATVATTDAPLQVWDTNTGQQVLACESTHSPVYRVAFSRDGSQIYTIEQTATGSNLVVRNVADCTVLLDTRVHRQQIARMQVTDNGLFVAGIDGVIHWLAVQSGEDAE